MLKIRLSQPRYFKRKWEVFIDSDLKRSFSNKRQALDYMVKIERELNECLLFINEKFTRLNEFYRIYFLADRDYRFKYQVENCFGLIQNRLEYIALYTEGDNYNPIISSALNVCLESLAEICDLIEKKSRTRYDMLTRNRICLHKKIIDLYKNSFEHFKSETIYMNHLSTKRA